MKIYVPFVLFALLGVPAGASSVAASSAARAWLQSHTGAPDELAELKGVNPEAYALVNALLTKQKLGLLNKRHPTASFADPGPAAQTAEQPESFTKAAASAGIEAPEPAAPHVALPYANVAHSHHDWLNWKPHASASDEAMVANVLGMVGGGGLKAAAAASENEPEPSAPAVTEAVTESAPTPKAASDWGAIGNMWGGVKKPQHNAVRQEVSQDAYQMEAPQPQVAMRKPAQQEFGNVENAKQDKDEKAVGSLLKMVAQLKGGKSAEKLLQKHHIASSEESPLANDLAAWGDAPEAPVEISAPVMATPVMAAPVQRSPVMDAPVMDSPVAVQAAPEKESSWGSIGGMWGVQKKPHHVAAAVETEAAVTSGRHSRHNWFNWKPKAAGEDEAMVANALNMVGGMKGGATAPVEEAPVAAPVEEVPVSAPPATVQAASETESSWGSIGGMWGAHKKPHHMAAAAEPVAEVPVAAPVEEVPVVQEAPARQAPAQDKDEKAVNSLLNMVVQLKGGSAEKLLKKHHVEAAETSLSSDEALFSRGSAEAPAATPVAQEAAPAQDSWGSIGGMLGLKHKAKPVAVVESQAAVESLPAGVPSEVQALFKSEPVHHAAPQLRKSADYTQSMKQKQDRDDSAVKKLLSMVAQLKGSGKAEKLAEKYGGGDSEESGLSGDMASFGAAPEEVQQPVAAPPAPEEVQQPVAPAPVPEEVQQPRRQAPTEDSQREAAAEEIVAEVAPIEAAPTKKKNLFLDSLTSSLGNHHKSAPHHVAALPKQNSYLSAFSWDDDSAEEKLAARAKMPKVQKSKDKLLSWLDPEPAATAQVAAVAAKPQAPVNHYLADLADN